MNAVKDISELNNFEKAELYRVLDNWTKSQQAITRQLSAGWRDHSPATDFTYFNGAH